MSEIRNEALQEALDEAVLKQEIPDVAVQLEKGLLKIENDLYHLIYESEANQSFNIQQFNLRYANVLNKYDYIVGDWGFEQLRLRGFYDEKNPRAANDKSIHLLEDYLNEYCNFGCSYFVLKRDRPAVKERKRGKRERKRKNNDRKESNWSKKTARDTQTTLPKKKNKLNKQTQKKDQHLQRKQPKKSSFTMTHKEQPEIQQTKRVVREQKGFRVIKKSKG